MNNWYLVFGKRLFDLFFSLLVVIFSWPFFLVIAQMIKLSSKGPIIFKQKRVGKNGKVFTLYKFRTMVNNAEKLKKKYLKLNEADGPVFKIINDPRFINGLGKFLARSGLDELPNILNILKEEMSWVGPRPLPVDEAKKIPPKYKKIRESILPGVTSLWVINSSHRLSFHKWMELDCHYAKCFSFKNDIQILLKTIKMVIESISNRLLKFI